MPLLFLVLGLLSFPSTSHAAWWSFLFPGLTTKAATTTPITPAIPADAPATTGISGSRVSNKPTVEELQERIAYLEQKLAEAEAVVAKAAAKTAAAAKPSAMASAPASAAPAGLSESAVRAKVMPALVTVQATSSGSGVVVDAQGHILTDAHTVWIQDSSNAVIGAAPEVKIAFQSGAQKTAKLVGIDEARDLAVYQLADKSASSYIKPVYDAGLSKGDAAYVASLPAANGISTGGQGFVAGTVSDKTASAVTVTTDIKPLDTGGALVNARGEFVGVPARSTCKVIEEMKNCLKYSVTAGVIRSTVPKLLAGMRLYKQMKNETAEEALVRGELQGVYGAVGESGLLNYAILNVTGNNSFDYFNGKLGTDVEGKIRKLYILKLKQIADSIYQAMDFLKQQAHDLDIFLVNESGSIASMGDYQRKVLAQIQAANAAKLREYQANVDLWSKRRNEYDSYQTRPEQASHDYLMEQGAIEESTAEYFKAERARILDLLSGESVNIF